MSRLLQRAVLRTRRLPGLRSLYRGIYAGAVDVSARAFLALPDVEAVYLHRGLSREGWEPGLSDIDLILVRSEPAPGENEAASLALLASRLSGLHRMFPMLGDAGFASLT